MVRKQRKSKKCVSCRRLKIKCDLERPACEYCVATGRRCEYDVERKQHAALKGKRAQVDAEEIGTIEETGTIEASVQIEGVQIEGGSIQIEGAQVNSSQIETKDTETAQIETKPTAMQIQTKDTEVISSNTVGWTLETAPFTGVAIVIDDTDTPKAAKATAPDYMTLGVSSFEWSDEEGSSCSSFPGSKSLEYKNTDASGIYTPANNTDTDPFSDAYTSEFPKDACGNDRDPDPYSGACSDAFSKDACSSDSGNEPCNKHTSKSSDPYTDWLGPDSVPHASSVPETAVVKQVPLTGFEYQLFKFFREFVVPESIANNQFVPATQRYFYTKADDIKDTVLNISCLYLYIFSDVSLLPSNFHTHPQLKHFAEFITRESHHLQVVRPQLYLKCLEYFNKCLKYTQAQSEIIGKQGRVIHTKDHALAVIHSSMILFSFLMTQPFQLMPMLSLTGQPDVITFCRGMTYCMGPAFPTFVGTDFEEMLWLCQHPPLGSYHLSHDFPILNTLAQELESLYYTKAISKEAYEAYHGDLGTLDSSLSMAVSQNNASTLYRWVFLMHHSTYPQMYQQDWFSWRQLFMYCCICYLAGLKIGEYKTPLSGFLEEFRLLNMDRYGRWLHSFDRDMYTLITKWKYSLLPGGFASLRTFDPSVVLAEQESQGLGSGSSKEHVSVGIQSRLQDALF